jgi:transcriptional regulator with XRE-family HTH domain
MVTARQPGPASKLPAAECAIAAANIRVLRQRNGWSQAYLGELMGWPDPSTVCAAEGHRGGRQRRFARWEIAQLAAIFGVPSLQLLTRCANCAGRGRIAGKTDHLDVPRYAAGICAAGYHPGTVERGLPEQFAATPVA